MFDAAIAGNMPGPLISSALTCILLPEANTPDKEPGSLGSVGKDRQPGMGPGFQMEPVGFAYRTSR